MKAAIGLTLLLVACGLARRDDEASIPPQCEAQVDQDPEVRALRDKAATNIALYAETRAPLRAARTRAASDCMRELGVIPPGGVEPRNKRGS